MSKAWVVAFTVAGILWQTAAAQVVGREQRVVPELFHALAHRGEVRPGLQPEDVGREPKLIRGAHHPTLTTDPPSPHQGRCVKRSAA